MADKVRWGILSTANIGRRAVTPALKAAGNCEVVAVASRDASAASAYATELGIERHYGSYQELLADPAVDAIYNPLPNSLHHEWTLKALNAGKHVLCEKPLGMNAQECLSMHEAARSSGRRLMEAFMYRFHPRTRRALEHLEEQRLGKLKLVRSSFTFSVTNPGNIRLQPELGGGALMDVGCYCVNVSRTLIGSEPLEAQAFAVWSDKGVDNELIGVLRFENDMFAQFHCALDSFRQEFVEVVGDEGRMRLDKAFLPGTADTVISSTTQSAGEVNEFISGVDEYRLMVEEFAACLLTGAEPRYDAREAAANMAAIEALYRSARAGGRPEAVARV
ncbi:MAG TPA: Gfo/Idh/MocA family oxidoreductase [Trueperaceae bacterium]|nr:Gfo/Idh/MocA family oxidoreductase [Trueperaceae bacterium]